MHKANRADYSIYGTQVGQQFVPLITLFTTASTDTYNWSILKHWSGACTTASCKVLCSCHR